MSETVDGEVVELHKVGTDDGELWFRHDGSKAHREGEGNWVGSDSAQARRDWYLQWLLTPESEREIKKKSEVAEFLGITYTSLNRYERDPRFQRALARESNRIRRVEKAEAVFDRLYDRALGGMGVPPAAANTAAKIWLEYTLGPLQDEENAVDFTDLSDEEVWSRLGKIVAERQLDS